MGYFKRLSAQLSRKELKAIKDKDAFNKLSMDRQGEIFMILESCKQVNLNCR